jgi:hypothetical protein
MARTDLATQAVRGLGLDPAAESALDEIRAELAADYQARFLELTAAVNRQASSLERIQETLRLLVKHVAPTLEGSTPVAVRIAARGENPDIASALVVADPIGMGFTLSQSDVARALRLPNAADLSVLVKRLKLNENGRYAVIVRRGKSGEFVNYHPDVVDEIRRLVLAGAPKGLDKVTAAAFARVGKKLSATR